MQTSELKEIFEGCETAQNIIADLISDFNNVAIWYADDEVSAHEATVLSVCEEVHDAIEQAINERNEEQMRSDLIAAVIIAAQHQTDSRTKAFTDELEMLKSSGLKYVAVRETLLSMLLELSRKMFDSAAATLIDDFMSSSYDIDKKYADDVRATIKTVKKEAREAEKTV